MSWKIPQEIDLWWWINEEVLRWLDIPVEKMEMKDLEHNLDISYRESIGTDDRNLTPRQTLENMEYEIRHAQKIRNADTNYPIEIYHFKWKRIVLDGTHRLAKLKMKWVDCVTVRKVTDELLPLIKKSPKEFLERQGIQS